MNNVYDYTVRKTNGDVMSLDAYKGQPLLIVNTASKCGYTPQFKGLQELHEQYQQEGLVVLGFPCDQFANQEFENIAETTEFCQVNYGVTFPLMAKVKVNGEEAENLFKFLKEENGGEIKWNFTKFLVDRNGQVAERFEPAVEPSDMKKDIEKVV
ncbi:glutathione peroxidase [Jeotgalibacillus haloalkalitolerans]|uniref:Glutathione peroxidase n=1 Tax=Jeotgalibacillus haloalkalitolerans TaxID=3104292 RepID=A0ABU5KI29_9BACL|nr:glutathione peroxidase [Jeotgalibacillus sp. HH7-29]MDZ5710887.1 glutathione peroxidase [Jeotgalibacillus sp. HH7-29]